MGEWVKNNQPVGIGDVFTNSSSDECGNYCRIFQVTGKRGKTLVTLRQIDAEPYIDETCDRGYGVVKLRPVRDSFLGGEFDVRAWVCVEGDRFTAPGEVMLAGICRKEEGSGWRRWYDPYGKYPATRSGWYGFDIWKKHLAGLPLGKASGSILSEVLP